MKKLLTLLFGAFAVTSMNAQTVYFEEVFNGGTVSSPPNGFTVVNNDACISNATASFPNNSWVVNTDGTDTFAAAQSWSNPAGCTSDDWLITSAINLSA
ncbi:MAG: hypothetical protein VYD24_02115, partial [Bacteroidota bacterium]|nr:hypothetical protein [Bacteroidota bacterium]